MALGEFVLLALIGSLVLIAALREVVLFWRWIGNLRSTESDTAERIPERVVRR
jgi:hypothetical protein